MKTDSAKIVASCFLTLICIAGCAGTTTIKKTNQLVPGMSTVEVKQILGDPLLIQFVSDRWVWQYSIHQPWKGYIPYYLVFSNEEQQLLSWYADVDEYMRQQQLWLRAHPPNQ